MSDPTQSLRSSGKPFLQSLAGEVLRTPPVWLMRQAGRYLPEYRALRAEAGDFKTMCYTPRLATEVTLQPIRRYGFDAAILFSDILTLPEALGREVVFEKGHGPSLEPLVSLSELKIDMTRLDPVYEAVASIRTTLAAEGFEKTALIGFAGAPWTVACYMVDGSGAAKDFPKTRGMAYREPENFAQLIDTITTATCDYLSRQIEAGAEAVQVFDSWAGLLPEDEFARWVLAPTKKIVSFLNARHPGIPVIGFPRQAGFFYERYIRDTGVTAVGIDTQVPLDYAASALQPLCPVQGNLDPFVLYGGGAALNEAVDAVKAALGSRAYIFNLGHGVHKDTPPEHVARLVERIRKVS